jgi:hypothetical protein
MAPPKNSPLALSSSNIGAELLSHSNSLEDSLIKFGLSSRAKIIDYIAVKNKWARGRIREPSLLKLEP